MKRKNIFEGKSYKAKFVALIDRRIVNPDRAKFSYTDVMVDFLNLPKGKDLPYPISKCPHVNELKKAFREVLEVVGKGNFEIEGNNRSKFFRYIGEDDDPLHEMRQASVINDLDEYWEFCQSSAGFLPNTWLKYFFGEYVVFQEMSRQRRKGEQIIIADVD